MENAISSLHIHAGLSEIQSQQLLQMASRGDFNDEDKEIFKAGLRRNDATCKYGGETLGGQECPPHTSAALS